MPESVRLVFNILNMHSVLSANLPETQQKRMKFLFNLIDIIHSTGEDKKEPILYPELGICFHLLCLIKWQSQTHIHIIVKQD